MTRTTIRSEDITAGQVKSADLASDAVDTTALETDIALLGFKVAANGSLAAYDLTDQTIDAFEDASGVDASASTDEVRNSSNYYSGSYSVTVDQTYNANTAGTGTDFSYTVPTGITSLAFKVWGGGGGGAAGGADPNGGGGGGYVAGDLAVSAGDVLKIAVSEQTQGNSGYSGGYSGIFLGTHTHANAQAIAGGGGASGDYVGGRGGDHDTDGGGGDGAYGMGGQGGTQSAGGASGSTNGTGAGRYMNATAGSALQGGDAGYGSLNSASTATYPGGGRGATASSYVGAGGGGGYYGGGGSDRYVGSYTAGGGGGGGSGYLHPTNVTNGTGEAGGQGTSGAAGGDDITGWVAPIGQGGGANSSGDYGGPGKVILSGSGSGANNMTLISNASTADSTPTTGDIVMTYTNGAGTATVNTDLKAYVSRDNGTTWTQATLSSEGTTGGHTILTAHNVDISGQPSGTSMRYKIETLNQSASKETRIQAVSLGWS